MKLDPETALIRARLINKNRRRQFLMDTAASVEAAWATPEPEKPSRISEIYDIATKERVEPDPNIFDGPGRPPANEPIHVFLTLKDLSFCETWQGMQAVLGLKGVPNDRLEKPDGSPADVRIDEREDGLMVEIL